MKSKRNLAILVLGLAALATLHAAPASIRVEVDKPAHKVSPTLWGIFFEDINLSADGGIYPELVRNLSFEDAAQPEYWTLNTSGGGSKMSVDSAAPLNPVNRRHLRLQLEGAATLVNGGYWGMNFVAGEPYAFKVAARATDGFTGPVTVRLEDASGRELARGECAGLSDRWKTFALTLTPAASDPGGRLSLSAQGKGTLWLDMVSLLPTKTWKGHGLRPDLAGMLDAMKPSFVRFPGGCWVEGDDLAHMYRWKSTIGDVALRQPLFNIWGYHATHGLAFHEYLQMSGDLASAPLFCINVGMSHREVVPMDQMGQWVQDALDALEYANGPTNSVWGSRRAKNGHPAPFGLKYLEIGNENGGPAYHERWPLFYDAIKSRHPEVKLVANVWGGYPTNRAPDIIDEHYYNTPEFFMAEASHYDRYDRKGPKVFVGEYAVTQNGGQGNLRAAIGEAAFMTGLERNSDVVVMASYAPLFVNLNHRKWNPDLINFDSARAFGLPGYYVQKLFSEHRGDVVLPTTTDSPLAENETRGGAVGVGTWATQAEYRDLKVTRGGQTLFASEFTGGTAGWKLLGGGEWSVKDGALVQSSGREFVRAIAGDKSWTDYTLTVKARKLGGREGFLILFNVADDEGKAWWNLGGWGNTQHGVEFGGPLAQMPGSIETGRWYDIRIETQGTHIKCFLDGKLIHDLEQPRVKSLYASATRDAKSGDVILKVVNTSAAAVEAAVRLNGLKRVGPHSEAIVLTSEKATDENSVEHPTKVSPKSAPLTVTGPNFTHAFPPNSLTVLRVNSR